MLGSGSVLMLPNVPRWHAAWKQTKYFFRRKDLEAQSFAGPRPPSYRVKGSVLGALVF